MLSLVATLWLAVAGHALRSTLSNLSYSGAPRLSLSGFIPTLQVTEDYILSQTNTGFSKYAGSIGCSASKPCVDGACCNSDGKLIIRALSHPKLKIPG